MFSCDKKSPFSSYKHLLNYKNNSPIPSFLGKNYFKTHYFIFYENWYFHSLPQGEELSKSLNIFSLPIQGMGGFEVNLRPFPSLKTNEDLYYFCSLNEVKLPKKIFQGDYLLHFKTGKKNKIDIFLGEKLIETHYGFVTINCRELLKAKVLKIKISKGKEKFTQGLLSAFYFKEDYQVSIDGKRWFSPTSKNLKQLRFKKKEGLYQRRNFSYKGQKKDKELFLSYYYHLRDFKLNGKKLVLNDGFVPKNLLQENNTVIFYNELYYCGLEPESQISLQEYQISIIQKKLYSSGGYFSLFLESNCDKIAIYEDEKFLTWASSFLEEKNYAYKFFPKGEHTLNLKVFHHLPSQSIKSFKFSEKKSTLLLNSNPQKGFFPSSLVLYLYNKKKLNLSFFINQREKKSDLYLDLYHYFSPFYQKEVYFPRVVINNVELEKGSVVLPKESLAYGKNTLKLYFDKNATFTPFPTLKRGKTKKVPPFQKIPIQEKVFNEKAVVKKPKKDNDLLPFLVFLYEKGALKDFKYKNLHSHPLWKEFNR